MSVGISLFTYSPWELNTVRCTTHRWFWQLAHTNGTILNPGLGPTVFVLMCVCVRVYVNHLELRPPSVVWTAEQPQNTSVTCGREKATRLESSA